MSKGRFNYYDPEYDPKVTDGNELLLVVNNNTFGFIVSQIRTKKVLVWGEDYDNDELQNPEALKDILLGNYSSVKAVVPSVTFTIIPKDLFKETDIIEYSRFLTPEPDDVLLTNEFDVTNNVVFAVSKTIMEVLKNKLNKASIFFAGKVFAATVNFARHDNANLYAHIEGNRLQLLYFRNAEFAFYNNFEFNNPDELMYFVVLTANELGLNLDETSVILSGDVNISDKKIHRVSDLLPKVYLNQTKMVQLPQGFLSHQILLLSGLTLCESLVEN
ncbi:DUF3822 family protein [Mucilaginibacter gracilis]|nr:DUF3822 family protein [Mucilaginibacter gracilis]